ncbi:MAG TPA: twin-arginine translocase subunit TatC [Thermodesulfobacteriota bacterium]|nr:twin-arginine translocase subunit TatC [Thermodesulfobacteriota bacterium]
MQSDTLLVQLDRLRWALVRTLVAVVLAGAAGYLVRHELLELLHRPLATVPLRFLRLTEPFFAYLKVSLFAGFFFVLPYVLHELWCALAPLAMGETARRYSWSVTLAASGLFYAGAAVCYFFVLGAAVPFLLGFGGEQLQPFLSVGDYLGLVMTLILVSGLMFELPLVLLVLARAGLVDARRLGRARRYAILVNAVVSAVLTPTPDIYTMLLMMAPVAALYELSVVLVRLFGKARKAHVLVPAP